MAYWPLPGWPTPQGSFQDKVPPPALGAGLCDLITVTFDPAWLPYILVALDQLALASTWQGTEAEVIQLQEQANFLIKQFMLAECPPTVEQPTGCGEDDMGCACLRFNNGKVQQLCCGVWTDVEGQGSGGPGTPQPGGGGVTPQPGGGTADTCFSMPATGRAFLPWTVSTGDQLLVQSPTGALNDGIEAIWHCPSGWQFFVDCVNSTEIGVTGDLVPTSPHMGLVALIGGTWYDVYQADSSGDPQIFTVPAGITNEAVVFSWNKPNDGLGFGNANFCIQGTNNQARTWVHEFDFTVSPFSGIWHPATLPAYTPNPAAVYVPGTGYQSVFQALVASPTDVIRDTQIESNIPANITRIQVYFTYAAGSSNAGGNTGYIDVNATIYDLTSLPTLPTSPLDTGLIAVAAADIVLAVSSGARNDSADPGGQCTITRAIISGTGTDPY